jgi:hypothetical protein
VLRAALRGVAVASAALIPLLPAPAAASGFDEASGKVLLDDAALGIGFESKATLPAGVRLVGLSAFSQPLPDFALEELFVAAPGEAIEGDGVLSLGGRTAVAFLDLRGAMEPLAGRRVEVRVWQRVKGTRAHVALVWYAAGTDDVLAGDLLGGVELGSVVFQPTGRATQDGWEEWSSGPVDARMGTMDVGLLRIFDEQLFGLESGTADYDGALRVELDGLDVRDLGEAAVPDVACRLVDETTTCGDEGLCLYGRCVDAAPVLGAVVHDADLRAQYIERRIFELRYFEGGRFPLTQIDLFEPSLRAELGPQATARSFRSALSVAYQRLADGHAAPPVTSLRLPVANAGVCLHRGVADLMPGGGEAPLVFGAQAGSPMADQLAPGDVLVAIDGIAPEDWAPLARRYSHYSGDPAARTFVTTPELFEAALLSGAQVTFARCPRTDRACTSTAVQRFTLDLAELSAQVWSGLPSAWLTAYLPCDFRLNSAVPGANDQEYAYAATRAEAGVQYLQINGMPAPNVAEGQAWVSTVTSALSGGPAKVVLDQRLGSGGSITAVDHLATYLTARADFYAMNLYPQLDRELTRTLRGKLVDCDRQASFTKSCGSFLDWPLGSFSTARPVATTAKVAVLTGADVSGNDFITRIMTYRTSGPTRIFGGARTYGAFGVVWRRPGFLGEVAGGSFQVHDSVFLTAIADTNLTFTTGRGVEPDQVVLQSQKDAVLGVDTVLEAAKAWVAQ